MSNSPELIGLSLSGCIADILNNRVRLEDVLAIFSSTMIRTQEDLEEALESYADTPFFEKDPEEGKKIARALFAEGKVVQPRLLSDTVSEQFLTEVHFRNDPGARWVKIPKGQRLTISDESGQYTDTLRSSSLLTPAIVLQWERFVTPSETPRGNRPGHSLQGGPR